MTRLLKSILRESGARNRAGQPSTVIPENVPDRHLYQPIRHNEHFFQPWLGSAFDKLSVPEVKNNTMLCRLKLYFFHQLFLQSLNLDGDYFEAGVGSGGAARLALNILRETGVRTKSLWLLDTFSGYPAVDPTRDGSHYAPGDCRCASEESVRQLVADKFVDGYVIRGTIPETLNDVRAGSIAFAHIDVNLYHPTVAAFEFCLKRMPEGGIILFDDYNWPQSYGHRRAVDEVCAATGQLVIAVPNSTQAFVIKRPI